MVRFVSIKELPAAMEIDLHGYHPDDIDISDVVKQAWESAATGSPIQKDGAMAGIARNVELYNLAFKLAWKYISEDQKRNQPNIARHLDDSIRRQLKEGTTEAVFIASEALKDVETS